MHPELNEYLSRRVPGFSGVVAFDGKEATLEVKSFGGRRQTVKRAVPPNWLDQLREDRAAAERLQKSLENRNYSPGETYSGYEEL